MLKPNVSAVDRKMKVDMAARYNQAKFTRYFLGCFVESSPTVDGRAHGLAF